MGILGSFLGGLLGSLLPDDKGCDWYCDECGAYMNDQLGFTTSRGEWKCRECGYINDVSEDNILFDDNDEDEDDDIPEGCTACGGDYPHCKDSCPLFDDD